MKKSILLFLASLCFLGCATRKSDSSSFNYSSTIDNSIVSEGNSSSEYNYTKEIRLTLDLASFTEKEKEYHSTCEYGELLASSDFNFITIHLTFLKTYNITIETSVYINDEEVINKNIDVEKNCLTLIVSDQNWSEIY